MAVTGVDRRKSLQELEKEDWGDPATGVTPMITRCLSLRRVPLKELSVDDLRLLIGQKIGSSYLVPICIEVLQDEPMIDASFYPGDLLKSVIQLGDDFWTRHQDSLKAMRQIIMKLQETQSDDEDIRFALEKVSHPLSGTT